MQTLDAKRSTRGGVPRPHYHCVVPWIEVRHIQRLGCRHTEAAALPHGIKRHSHGAYRRSHRPC